MFRRSTSQTLLDFFLLFAAGRAAAFCLPVPYHIYVGNDARCNTSDIQTAINSVACPGTTVVVTNELSYTGQHLTISNTSLTIAGSSNVCNAPVPICDPTIGCGSGGVPAQIAIGGDGANPVFSIDGSGSVTLANLAISGGKGADGSLDGGGGISVNGVGMALRLDNVSLSGNSGGYGGGVAFYGDGSLTLDGVSVHDNSASTGGGGISAYSSFIGKITVTFVDDPGLTTEINNNTAAYYGGGIHIGGTTHLVAVASAEGRISIHDNQAGQDGGGIYVAGAMADIGLPGRGIYANTASFGGGIDVGATNQSSGIVRVFGTDPANPTLIAANTASSYGGGIFVNGGTSSMHGTTCLFDAGLANNTATQAGSAIYVSDAARLVVNPQNDAECVFADVAALGARHCDPTALNCNRIALNEAGTGGTPATIEFTGAAQIAAQRLHLQGNNTAYAVRGQYAKPQASIAFSECLFDHNATTNELVNLQGAGASFDSCTFADDSIGGGFLFASDTSLGLTRSIVREASSLPVYNPTSTPGLTAQYLMLSGPKLPTDRTVVYADPSFVDAANGDYHLQPTSQAIDFAPANVADFLDLDGHTRDVDLPYIPNRFGPHDLGAYERQLACAVSDTIFCDGFGP